MEEGGLQWSTWAKGRRWGGIGRVIRGGVRRGGVRKGGVRRGGVRRGGPARSLSTSSTKGTTRTCST